jgi:hypothetical protein
MSILPSSSANLTRECKKLDITASTEISAEPSSACCLITEGVCTVCSLHQISSGIHSLNPLYMQEFSRLMQEILANDEEDGQPSPEAIASLWELAVTEAGPNKPVDADVLAKVRSVQIKCCCVTLWNLSKCMSISTMDPHSI